jgi:hypothetical protein
MPSRDAPDPGPQRDALEPADRLALRRLAAAERVDRREQISVTFGEPADDD